ncbi:MAG TPA: ribonuclease P protein component [Saprospirales bacterium]|nr:ribonuclease P protein component [Saprospirales bacterium]HAY71302.1 ribonuclease P protein component [Saprospirales bacterium]HRQ30918.1 ribonuclease P protein component [Saprospiraceae bacterium]
MKKHDFPRTECLKSSKLFRKVILEGHSVFQHPLKLHFMITYLDKPASVSLLLAGFSISKRKHPKATTRNLLKRRMKEAFRLNKELAKETIATFPNYHLDLVVIYQVGEICNYKQIEQALIKCLQKLKNQLCSFEMNTI